MKNKNSLRFVLAFMVLLSCAEAQAQSTTCHPDPWYRATIKIDPKGLPQGILVAESTGWPKGWGAYLINPTTTPLVIVPPETVDLPHMSMKLVKGEMIYCMFDTRLTPCTDDHRADNINEFFEIPEIRTALMSNWIEQDGRPDDAVPPPKQSFTFYAGYGEKRYTINGQVSYILNERYEPRKCR